MMALEQPYADNPSLSDSTVDQLVQELGGRTECGLVLFAADGKLQGTKAWGEYYWGPIWNVLGLASMGVCHIQVRLAAGLHGWEPFPPDIDDDPEHEDES